jgi:hypothetical protein
MKNVVCNKWVASASLASLVSLIATLCATWKWV